jgi:hypothetical protein
MNDRTKFQAEAIIEKTKSFLAHLGVHKDACVRHENPQTQEEMDDNEVVELFESLSGLMTQNREILKQLVGAPEDIDSETMRALFPGSPDDEDGPVDHPNRPLEPSEFKKSWEYKYVRFADGKVLFCDSCAMCMSHQALVKEYPQSEPVSAGKIQVSRGKWCLSGYGSDTAHLTHLSDDDDILTELLKGTLELDWDIRM